MEGTRYLGRSASIIYRQGNRFFDRELAPYFIGCGQQFFLLRVYENEGISVLDLARLGQFDKGTATRAVQKLEEQGYIRTESDPHDRRIRRLYTTEVAKPIVERVLMTRELWNSVLTQGMSREEIDTAARLLNVMAKNAYTYMKQEDTEREA